MPYRILYANSHPFWGGGAEAVLLKLASSLNRSEFEPVLVTSKDDSLAARFRDAGVETLTVPYGYFRSTHGLWDYVRGPRELRRLLRSLGIDLVHTHCDRSIRLLVRAAAPLEIPVVSHVHDTGRDWFSRRFLPYLNRTAAIVTVSRWLKDFGQKRGADPTRLRFIYNGTDPEPFRAAARTRDDVRRTLGLAPNDVAVGLVGSLQPEKGQVDLLRCAADPHLEALNVRFFFVGGEQRGREGYGQYLRDLAASQGVTSRVTFLGFREDVPALMAAFDLAAAPFGDEGFPGVVIESLSAGLPVIGYRSGTLAEQVREYRDGFLVQPGDFVSLAAAISCLAANAPLRARMSAAARERSREFTFERHLEAMGALYREVLRGRLPRLAAAPVGQ